MSQFNPAPINSGGKLIARYVHSGNKVIQPVSLDKATGIWTTTTNLVTGVGLAIGSFRQIIPVHKTYANNSIPREWKSINNNNIEVISENTFYLTTAQNVGGRVLSYPDPNTPSTGYETHMQLEINTSGTIIIDLTQFDVREIRVVLMGQRNRPGWTFSDLYYTHAGGTGVMAASGMVDGRDWQTLKQETSFRYEPALRLLMMQGLMSMTRTWTDTNGTWGDGASNQSNQRNFALVDNFKADSIRIVSNVFANNTVCEIYDTRGSE